MSYQYMSSRLVEVIQELRSYLGPEAQGLSDEDVVHKVMCKFWPMQQNKSRPDRSGRPYLYCPTRGGEPACPRGRRSLLTHLGIEKGERPPATWIGEISHSPTLA